MQARVVARVAVLNRAGEVLLCTTRDGAGWVLPGGTVEPGETLVEAAEREALEEVGLQVTVGRMLFLQEFQPKGRIERVYEVAFLAHTADDGPARFLHKDVDGPLREVRWFSEAALAALGAPVYPDQLRTGAFSGLPDAYLGLAKG